jgi:hypothetical protein
VLTFAEIERLLGFPLPAAARLDSAWWRLAGTAGQSAAPSNAWALAGRMATVNLSAGRVVFDVCHAPPPGADVNRRGRSELNSCRTDSTIR